MTNDSLVTDPPMNQATSFIKRVFGFDAFRPGQEDIVAAVLEGSDLLAIMPTGGGKSLCYQVPAFVQPGMTLVISPLIALMKDQVDTLRVLDVPAGCIHSLMSLKEQEDTLVKVSEARIKLLYVSPERLRNRQFLETLTRQNVTLVAVDEAHCISQWGHDFRPDYLRIREALETLGRPQTMALTATAPERVRTDIIDQLDLRTPRIFIAGFDRPNLYWEVAALENGKEKLEIIHRQVKGLPSGAAIIYAGTRKKVEQITDSLQAHGIMALGYHAGMEREQRLAVQDSFMEGRSNVAVATNAFGMGIDRSDIRMVIHHTFPGSIEAYYQESGRAGRDGDPATCLLLYSPDDRHLQEFFIETRFPGERTIWEVYNRLLGKGEEVIWITYQEIGTMGEEKIPAMAVGSCLKILEEAGALKRLNRYDNQAELFLYKDTKTLLETLPPRARNRKAILAYLESTYGVPEIEEGIRFLPEDMAQRAGLTVEVLRRTLNEMESLSQLCFIPPFRGRGVRILRRMKPRDLSIDFEALRIRKAYELTRLDRVMAYAGGKQCRRKFLLEYFGERRGKEHCGACDICSSLDESAKPADRPMDDPHLEAKILSAVARLKGQFGAVMVAKVLTGSKEQALISFGLNRLSTYGLLSGFGQAQVQEWINELISRGYLFTRSHPMGKRIYRVLGLTPSGQEAMTNLGHIPLSPPKGTPASPAQVPAPLKPSEFEVFNRLRELRIRLAREEGLPAYCIFQDRTLREMARTMPSTKGELSDIVGVGEATLRKYGDAFLDALQGMGQDGEAG